MNLSQNDIDSKTSSLPLMKEIPAIFFNELYGPNLYSRMVDAWYCGSPVPEAQVSFNPGFRADGKAVKAFIMYHLNDIQPEHEHKIAGCAYLLSKILTLK